MGAGGEGAPNGGACGAPFLPETPAFWRAASITRIASASIAAWSPPALPRGRGVLTMGPERRSLRDGPC